MCPYASHDLFLTRRGRVCFTSGNLNIPSRFHDLCLWHWDKDLSKMKWSESYNPNLFIWGWQDYWIQSLWLAKQGKSFSQGEVLELWGRMRQARLFGTDLLVQVLWTLCQRIRIAIAVIYPAWIPFHCLTSEWLSLLCFFFSSLHYTIQLLQ